MSLKGKVFGWINENDGAISNKGDECRREGETRRNRGVKESKEK
jgi:hypothetical protein